MPSRPYKFSRGGAHPPVSINYTSREFTSIRRDILEYANRYYPDTVRDFSENSFGSLMVDSISYVGDILSFYLDYNVNEAFLDTAAQYDNVVRLAENSGYKNSGPGSAYGIVSFYVIIPSNASGTGPDQDYLKLVIKRGTRVRSRPNGSSFILLNNVRFDRRYNDTVVARVNETTGVPTAYAIKSYGRVVSGQMAVKTFNIGNFERFRSIEIEDGRAAEIISVIDSNGNRYYEVDYLSQNVVYKSVANSSADASDVPAIMKPIAVPRRFTTSRLRGAVVLQFGYGSEEELSVGSVVEPNNILLDIFGKNYKTDISFDPSRLMTTDKFGVGPSNTTLTITYRQNPITTVNVPTGQLKSVSNLLAEFDDPTKLSSNTKNNVLASIECYNERPIVGGTANPTKEEIRQRALDMFPTQNRAVTKLDYEALAYNMDAKFGLIKRCAIYQDPNSLKRNLNMYILAEDGSGNLAVPSDSLKRNLKTYLMRYKMLNDTIDIIDGKIVNIGINYSAKLLPGRSKDLTLSQISTALINLTTPKLYFGEPFNIARIYKTINNVAGVMDCLNVEIVLKTGLPYSTTRYNLQKSISADGTELTVPKNVVLEVRFPNLDIKGTLK